MKINDVIREGEELSVNHLFTGKISQLHRDPLPCARVSELKSILFIPLCGCCFSGTNWFSFRRFPTHFTLQKPKPGVPCGQVVLPHTDGQEWGSLSTVHWRLFPPQGLLRSSLWPLSCLIYLVLEKAFPSHRAGLCQSLSCPEGAASLPLSPCG